MLTVEELLAGPRGRGLCVAAAQVLGGAWWQGDPGSSVDELVSGIARTDLIRLRNAGGPLDFVEAIDLVVCRAMYWQEPDDEDVHAGNSAAVEALTPLAEAIVTNPATAWWDSPADLEALRYTSRFSDQFPVKPPAPHGICERLDTWHQTTRAEEARAAVETPADPWEGNVSGAWWSVPGHAQPVVTTRPLPGLGAVSLMWQEDSLGGDNAAIWPIEPTGTPHIWEIARPADWARLVESYPLDVTRSRQHDWYRSVGRIGRWAIPDWAAVAADWDAVHISVAGYLSTATRALPLSDGETATVMGGASPDETWWLTESVDVAGPQETWCLDRSYFGADPEGTSPWVRRTD